MRAFLAILGFELRLHAASPLFWGVALLFFALHLLTITETGVNISDNDLLNFNSAYLIFQTELVLGVFGMVPAIIFAVTAITRDLERNTREQFFTTPVPRTAFVLGRFSAGALAAVLVGFAGILGALAGSFMPWLDQGRIAPFDWRPWVVCFTVLVLPNLVVFCALFFSVAAVTRSAALTFGAALGLLVLEVVIVNNVGVPIPRWLLLADPFAALPIRETVRYWTVSELNTLLPTALLLPNRLLWLGLALAALGFTVWRYRMELVPAPFGWLRRTRKSVAVGLPQTILVAGVVEPRFDVGSTLRQLLAQLRMDWRGVWQSPLFWLVLVLAASGTWNEAASNPSALFDLPLYPATTLMLGFYRYGLFQFVLLLVIFYSAVLVHRERDSGVDGISGAAPCPDWIPVSSKTAVLCGIVALLLLVSMATSLAVQALADFRPYEIGLYLQGLFVYNGFYFFMLCVLAVIVQVFSPGKWSGMVLAFIVLVAVLVLDTLGFEHLLYGFRIPYVVHSDMNGFGQSRLQTYTLIAYWSAFCVLLLVLGHLLFPRGYYASFRERLRDARTRLTAPVVRTSAVAFATFAAIGGFIFYNTNVLNDYVTREDDLQARARYELDYGSYRNAPTPSIQAIDLQVDLFAAERRLESRGSAVLRNNKPQPITEFVLSVDPRNRINALTVAGGSAVLQDSAQGFHVFRLATPLQPGATLTVTWDLTRTNRGFVNSLPDNELVANGTFINAGSVLPWPGYSEERELSTDRARFGLPPAARLPALGDPAYLNQRGRGLDSRATIRVAFSTDADQTAVAPGVLKRAWEEAGRRHFEYVVERPAWPIMSLSSARYTVARDTWNDVALEVYHDAKHPWNIATMLNTAKLGLDYYSREFAPYPLEYYRLVEYPRYRSNVQAFMGTIAYSEISGFMTDLRGWDALDYATLHELAHQWWGNVYGAPMQGRQLLNEGLALFALQDLIGAARVNQALSTYHARFVNDYPPFPTSRDLIDELRAVAGPDYQALITDLFEKIMLYDVAVTAATATAVAGEYAVTLELTARQFESDGMGVETEVPLDTWFNVVVFPQANQELLELTPLYQQKHRLQSGTHLLTIRVPELPGKAGIDPWHLMIDRKPDDNVIGVTMVE
jgi:ABC-type transport system involved in multi-copper enzyme maturation permease subunit